MQAETDLLHTQRRFLAALREPIFGESRKRSELPPREGAVSEAFVRTAQELLTPSATLTPVERFELYHRQYWYRLLDSIAEDFPALRKLLGDHPFWRLMEAYLEAGAPRSHTLRHLGSGLADFIAARSEVIRGRSESLGVRSCDRNAPSTSVANRPERVDAHPDPVDDAVHAGDLARLEYALCHAFEAGEEAPVPPIHLGQERLERR